MAAGRGCVCAEGGGERGSRKQQKVCGRESFRHVAHTAAWMIHASHGVSHATTGLQEEMTDACQPFPFTVTYHYFTTTS